MTVSEAESLLSREEYFYYVKGKPLKTSFEKFPLLDPWGFDRDQGGPGTLQALVKRLKTAGTDEPVMPANKPVVHNGRPLSDFKGLKKFDQVYFVNSFAEELDRRGIPYPYDWHMFMEITSDDKYLFVGSMGGRFLVGGNEPVVKSL